ncbi:MAG: arsenic efflux protein [Clostridia bacterium]|nr:arsenic efflux protein [Clostridia bacterium]
MFAEILEVLLDALLDTLKVFPFILAAFILIAAIERQIKADKIEKALGGKLAPLIGSATGVVPICGFSAMAAKFYREGVIAVGTLVAIFIAASDEGVIVLLTGGKWREFLILTAVKIAIAVAVGYVANGIFRGERNSHAHGDGAEFSHCHHGGEGESNLHAYLIHPLLHCLKTTAFVLAVNVALGMVIYFVGEENFSNFMAGTGYFQPFVSALVGLIPNCAPSVVIAETFVKGNLSFGGLLAGLTANAGVGLALIFGEKDKILKNLAIVFTLYFVGVMAGEVAVLLSFIG